MKKRKTSESKNNLNQEDLHRSVISKEINNPDSPCKKVYQKLNYYTNILSTSFQTFKQ